MAIYSERERALELEEEAKAGARASSPPERAPWKDIRREAAAVRRDIPESVRSLRNDPEVQTGTGASSNPLRGPNPTDQPGRLGDPGGAVAQRLGEPTVRQVPKSEFERSVREVPEAEVREAEEEAANRRADWEAWKRDIHDRLSPEEEARALRRQERWNRTQQEVEDYLREHPGFRVDEQGEMWGDDVTPEEAREMHRRIMRRNRAQHPLVREHQRARGR